MKFVVNITKISLRSNLFSLNPDPGRKTYPVEKQRALEAGVSGLLAHGDVVVDGHLILRVDHRDAAARGRVVDSLNKKNTYM